MDKSKLLAAASLRQGVVVLEGETVRVREVNTNDFARYGELVKTDRLGATAYLIQACAVDDAGAGVFTAEEALEIARSVRLSVPLMNEIMRLSGFAEEGADEKHADADRAV